MNYEYISRFKKMGFGMFVHFGLYSVKGHGEWHLHTEMSKQEEYNSLMHKFDIAPDWAEKLVSLAKKGGCKYITLTTRHHDGFSLYDTCGLSDFDAPHSLCGRDLVREFTDECNRQGIVPFFYHTYLDWYNKDYENDFPKYMDYLVESVKILCTNYGKIGGVWFDGKWDKKDADWQEDRLYGMIRSLQPEAMIINNTGLDALGKTGHPEIDSVTFERGKPCHVVVDGKPIAGEVCQGVTDHWGYSAEDICTKSVTELLNTLIDCRANSCNLLLNVGPLGNGLVRPIEAGLFEALGRWIEVNKNIVYECVPAGINATNADVLTDGEYYYAIIKDVPMCYNTNVTRMKESKMIVLDTSKKITDAVWLDNGETVKILEDGSFFAWPFDYGYSYGARVAKFKLK